MIPIWSSRLQVWNTKHQSSLTHLSQAISVNLAITGICFPCNRIKSLQDLVFVADEVPLLENWRMHVVLAMTLSVVVAFWESPSQWEKLDLTKLGSKLQTFFTDPEPDTQGAGVMQTHSHIGRESIINSGLHPALWRETMMWISVVGYLGGLVLYKHFTHHIFTKTFKMVRMLGPIHSSLFLRFVFQSVKSLRISLLNNFHTNSHQCTMKILKAMPFCV